MDEPKKDLLNTLLGESLGKDLNSKKLEDVLSSSFSKKEGKAPPPEFVRSWERTRYHLLNEIVNDGRLSDHSFFFEFQPIPGRQFAIDLIILGSSASNDPRLTVVEIKMWPRVSKVKNGICHIGSEERHPLDQAEHYASNIRLMHSICTENKGEVHTCSFVPLTIPKPKTGNKNLLDYPSPGAPNFLTATELIEFHLQHAPNASITAHVSLLKSRKLHTSPGLAAFALLPFSGSGSTGIGLSAEQEAAANEILKAAKNKRGEKKVIIISGGPGTGKSVIALKVFGEMLKNNIGAFRYLTNSANFRDYLKGMLFTYLHTHSSTATPVDNNRVDFLVEKFSAVWEGRKKNEYRLLIADEAQSLELRHVSGPVHHPTLTPPVIDIIAQAEVSAFFLDGKQSKKTKMVGSVDHIRTAAKLLGVQVVEFELHKQFRCGGRDEAVEVIEECLGHRNKPNPITKVDLAPFEIKTYNCIHKLEDDLGALPKDELTRIIAGYAWEWDKKQNQNTAHHDVKFKCRCGKDFGRSWNIAHTSSVYDPRQSNGYIHATKDDFKTDILGIHTTQGIEFDNIGIILGDDVDLDSSGHFEYVPIKKTDSSVNPDILRNNYRTISTRAKRRVFYYCTNKNVADSLEAYLKERLV